MNPRLVAMAGPLEGANFSLTEDEISIGRDTSNQILIDDLSVSRRHCLIQRAAGQFKITDLNSHNGTFVNDLPTQERSLEHGDRIRVGKSLFLFLTDEDGAVPLTGEVHLDDRKLVSTSTVQLRVEDALYLRPEKLLLGLAPTARVARDLSALLKISTAINSIRSLAALERRLLELIFEVIPAERGAILLAKDDLEEPTSVCALDKLAGPDQPVRVSRTVTRQVLREGIAVLSNYVLEDEALSSSESLIASRTSSLLCVPLTLFERVLGVIYLDTSDPVLHFDEGHLQLMTAIAGIAALAIENARRFEWLEGENQRLQADLKVEHNMIGENARMREVYQFIAKVAPTDSTVLIRGESGTGKELAARAIHQNSPRATKPFMAINCAALTETLLESELFGHEKGAFTGAIAQKKGKLEIAYGGTVFLDEVGELAPALQTKLLRVLQEREFERVGGTRPIKVDIRLIAATNRDLEKAVSGGTFRQDLYYRLNVVQLTLPPLRERREDIPLLASHFVAKYSQKCKRKVIGIAAEARACLFNYDWPGNVRELENAIERAVVLGSTDLILLEDLPDALLETEPPADVRVRKFHELVNEAKKQIILRAVEQANGNYTEAAKQLGVHPNNLHRLIRNMNLKGALKT